MGRTDAVAFVLEVVAEAKRLEPRLVVDFLDGWEKRGNGSAANYEGLIVHHTASASTDTNPFPTQSILVNGRSDLSGPLCNVAGPRSPADAPRLVVVAAFPANHAGASGGKSMGPLPVTGLFNPRVLGLEIDYAGTSPMTEGQHRAATVLGRAVSSVLTKSAECVRAHFETSITGKWDPGYASGKSIDMAAFRADITNLSPSTTGGLSMADINSIQAALDEIITELRGPNRAGWPVARHDLTAAKQPKLTLVQMLVGLDQELKSNLARPAAGAAADTLFGQVLSSRAEATSRAKTGGVDSAAVAKAVSAAVVAALPKTAITTADVEAAVSKVLLQGAASA